MVTISYQDQNYRCEDSETVLDCLTRHGVSVPFSCRNGICQTCLVRATKGEPAAAAQKDLKPTLAAQHYFLACLCKPQQDLEIALASDDINPRITAQVMAKQALNHNIMRITLKPDVPFNFKAGQFLNIFRDDHGSRSYSIASAPQYDSTLELHIRRIANGRISSWLHDVIRVSDRLTVSGPLGNSFYVPGNNQQRILLVGTGSGLAPLWGIIRDALDQEHTGPIHLFHGARTRADLYLVDELRALAQAHSNVNYYPCISSGDVPKGHTAGRADEVALVQFPQLKDWRIYLCGNPDMVTKMKRKIYLAGASLKEIFADPFV